MASTQRTLTRRLGLLAGGGAQEEKIEADNPHYEMIKTRDKKGDKKRGNLGGRRDWPSPKSRVMGCRGSQKGGTCHE